MGRCRIALLVALLGLVPGACAYSPIVTPASPATALAPIPSSQVQFYESESAVPFEYVEVATITPRQTIGRVNTAALRPYRDLAARRGADALILTPTLNGRKSFLAVHLTTVARQRATAATAAGVQETTGAGAQSSSSGGCVGSCDVHVRGYTRRDGTYVRPHTRSSPGSGGGRRH